MGLFRRRGVDVVDLTQLQKKGILKSRQETQGIKDVIDFSSYSKSRTSVSNNQSTGESPLGFLSNLANASKNPLNIENSIDYGDKLKEARKAKLAEFNSMKVKLDDFEFVVRDLRSRLEKMEDKIRELERK